MVVRLRSGRHGHWNSAKYSGWSFLPSWTPERELDWVPYCAPVRDWAKHSGSVQDWVPHFVPVQGWAKHSEEASRRATHCELGQDWVPHFAEEYRRAYSVGEPTEILPHAKANSAVFRFFLERRWVPCVRGLPKRILGARDQERRAVFLLQVGHFLEREHRPSQTPIVFLCPER